MRTSGELSALEASETFSTPTGEVGSRKPLDRIRQWNDIRGRSDEEVIAGLKRLSLDGKPLIVGTRLPEQIGSRFRIGEQVFVYVRKASREEFINTKGGALSHGDVAFFYEVVTE